MSCRPIGAAPTISNGRADLRRNALRRQDEANMSARAPAGDACLLPAPCYPNWCAARRTHALPAAGLGRSCYTLDRPAWMLGRTARIPGAGLCHCPVRHASHSNGYDEERAASSSRRTVRQLSGLPVLIRAPFGSRLRTTSPYRSTSTVSTDRTARQAARMPPTPRTPPGGRKAGHR